MTRFYDAHCHIQNTRTPDELVQNMHAYNVELILCNATQPIEWDTICEMTHRHKNIFGALGIHPWHISQTPYNWQEELKKRLIATPKLMVGEIGLDKHHPNIDKQIAIFQTQLQMAAELRRGACIHCVGAWDKILHTLKENKRALPPVMIFHKFNGNIKIMQDLMTLCNAYFSFADKPNPDIIGSIPQDRILTESDTDTPADVIANTKNIANLLNMDLNTLTFIIKNNITQVLDI